MKDKYIVKRTCWHCGHEFEFWNTEKFIEKTENIYDTIKKKLWIIECPNCGSRVVFKTKIIDLNELKKVIK